MSAVFDAWEAYIHSGISNSTILGGDVQNTRDTDKIMGEVNKAREKLAQLELILSGSQECGARPQPTGVTRGDKPNAFIERLKLPKFNGNITDYAHFKKLFNDLIPLTTMAEALFIEYLRNAVPTEHQYHLKGVQDRAGAWERLDARFGDRGRSIRQVMKKLEELELRGTACEKVERLSFEVSHTRALLDSYDAGRLLPSNFNIVATLIDKLPRQYATDWWDHCADRAKDPVPGEDEWDVFLSWLEKKRRAAVKERGAEDLKIGSGKANTAQVARAQCSKCSGAHKTASCTLPSTMEAFNVENDMDGEPIEPEEEEMVVASVAAAQDGTPVQKSPKYLE